MSTFAISKVLSSLPATLAPDTAYCVRVGAGFDLYMTDDSGQIAYTLNLPPAGLPIRPTQTGAFTFAADDANALTPMVLSAAAAATIPAHSAVAFDVGTTLYIGQGGDGVASFAAASGVTLQAPHGAATTATGDIRSAVQVAIDEWWVQ